MKLPPETSPCILGTDRETPPGNTKTRETAPVRPLSENLPPETSDGESTPLQDTHGLIVAGGQF